MADFETKLDKELSGMTTWKAIRWGVTILFVLAVLGVAARGLGLIGTVTGAATGVINRTLDPDNILATYEGFYDRWQAYVARLAQVKSYAVIVDSSTGASKTQAMVEREAMRQSCRELAARYNADSLKANRDIFKGREAPATLDEVACNE